MRAKEDFEQMPAKNFNIRAIFSIFDTNADGKITREEFNSVSETEYNAFTNQLKEYNAKNNRSSQNNSIWSYAHVEKYLNDHISPDEITEDEVLFDNVDDYFQGKQIEGTGTDLDSDNKYSGTHDLEETFNLPDISSMTSQEMIQELESYVIKPEKTNTINLTVELTEARRERAKHDIGSDSVDGHIGTFIQNRSGVCTVLAQIGAMSDAEIRELFIFDEGHSFDNPMVDENGKKYWNIKFPIDKDNSKVVRITEDEIKSGQIEIEEYGEKRTIKEFPEGDGDITAITMAFVKRFGSDIVQSGEWAYITRNRFTKPDAPKYHDNQHLERITDLRTLEGSVIGGLNANEQRRKGFDVKSLKDEDLSWIKNESYRYLAQNTDGVIYTMANGQRACITSYGVFLEDGRKIELLHAMEIRRYDEQTNELIISGSEMTNISELRIPAELLQFYETASFAGTPGVEETPDPGLIDDKI